MQRNNKCEIDIPLGQNDLADIDCLIYYHFYGFMIPATGDYFIFLRNFFLDVHHHVRTLVNLCSGKQNTLEVIACVFI